MNSNADELSADLKTLETVKSQEKDAGNIAAFDRVIRSVSDELGRHRSYEADKPLSDIIPRYPVIDLGTNLFHPIKITNSGYVLGRNNSTNYVWFEGIETALQPRNAGDVLTVEDIDESGTVVGTEMSPDHSGDKHRSINLATWEKRANPPKLTPTSPSELSARKSAPPDVIRALKLPQPADSHVTPVAVNGAMALLPAQEGPPVQPAQLVTATEVIGNDVGGGYVWEMTPTFSTTKTFEGPTLINDLLPGEPKTSPWKMISVASINDGGTIVGTAIYTPTSPSDPMAAGPHGVMLMPLAIVRETPPGSAITSQSRTMGLMIMPRFRSLPRRHPTRPQVRSPILNPTGRESFIFKCPDRLPPALLLRAVGIS